MRNSFDYDTYRYILRRVSESRVNLLFPEVAGRDDEPYFLLRHDVDYSPSAALRMAEEEARLGLRATYFILLSSPFYNILSESFCNVPRRLVELGHDVGVHYDLGVYETMDWVSPPALLHQHAGLLGALSGRPVQTISMHNPSTSGVDPFSASTEFINAYDPRFTEAITYISDSCGAWRNQASFLFEEAEIPPQVQLLVHPIFWQDRTADRWSRLDRFVADHVEGVYATAETIRTSWTRHSGVIEHDSQYVR